MTDSVQIAIIGAGPAGLSAAARAAATNTSHLLLEASPQLANTVFRYQKGKHVMAEPAVLPLRAALGFEAGTRERILKRWHEGAIQTRANIRYRTEVTALKGQAGAFTLNLASGDRIRAAAVVLAIGLQGNLRKLEVPGEDLEYVQYQLDDPDEYRNETIVVVGAGDAAIENALALAPHNTVIMLNRRDEFARAKEGNLKNIVRGIEAGQLECLYNAAPLAVEALPMGDPHRLRLQLKTKTGATEILCDRIVARLGALPPRKFVESCGITFSSDDPAAVPTVTPRYESNVPGLYIIGALAGYPLIKQCLNQGYEVVEFICGRAVEPADNGLLRAKFARVPGFRHVDAALAAIRERIPLFASLTPLQLREFMLDSEIRTPAPGEVVVQYNDYTNTFFSILGGQVEIRINPHDPSKTIPLGSGKFFGEMSLISGRRRSATIVAGANCVLIETPRRSMNKLIQSVEAVRREIDEVFLLRAIRMQIAPEVPEDELIEVVKTAHLRQYNAGDVLFKAGDRADYLHLIRSGSVTVSHEIGGRDVVIAYLPSGNYVGELALL
ncbi:MAG: NAD(P)-binding domain-containing protein, partial [Gammaproteobacteria bacterium]